MRTQSPQSQHFRTPYNLSGVRKHLSWLSLLAILLVGSGSALATSPDAGENSVRLPDHVLPALANTSSARQGSVAKDTSASARGNQTLSLTFVLKRDDETGFQQYLNAVYDQTSPSFRQFLTQAQIAERFGPSQQIYDQLLGYLRAQNFQLVEGSTNRLTLTVHAARGDAERAFAVDIGDYVLGQRKFYANDRDPALPSALAAHIQAVSGLSNLAQPSQFFQGVPPTGCGGVTRAGAPSMDRNGSIPAVAACETRPCFVGNDGGLLYKIFCEWTSWGRYDPPPPGLVPQIDKNSGGNAGDGQGPASDISGGAGQTVALVEFDTFHRSDVSNFLSLMGLPASEIGQLSDVHVNGGATLGAGESEVLLDIDTLFVIAPGANVVVFDAPLTGTGGFQAVFNAMLTHGVSVISNSWAYCENQTTLADVQSIDAILQSAAVSGVSVFNGAGDSGSACLDGAAGTVAVPADSPSATAVGGTAPADNADNTYGGESWWNGSGNVPTTGQGGFGSSLFFSRPGYQSAANSSPRRSVPDVVATADPAQGVMICQADAGGCPTGLLYGGTSFAAPTWGAFAALLNQKQGVNMGHLNAAIYPFANTSAFHDAASMGSDFAHVGLGSPNLDRLYLALTGQTAGSPSAGASKVHAGNTFPSYIVAPPITVSADGTSTAPIIVRLLDANGNSISGKTVTLSGTGSATITPAHAVTTIDNGAAVFAVSDLAEEAVAFSAEDTTDGIPITQTANVTFVTPPAASGSTIAFTDAVPADGTSIDTITVTLADALGRPTPGKQIALTQAGSSVVSGPNPPLTNASGQIAFTVTDTVQETVTYTAIDITDGNLPVPGAAPVTFNASGGDNCGITRASNADVSAGSGYAITPFATGFVPLNTNFGGLVDGCRGASGVAFDALGNLYVSDLHSGNIYKFGAAGGLAGPATRITPSPLGPGIESLAFGADGKFYAAQNATTGNFFTGAVIEINPVTGALVRTVASSITCASFLVADPVSGDLFVNDSCAGGGSENGSLWRIANPGSASPVTTIYASTPGVNGGMSFAPGGTLYMLSYRDNGGAGGVVKVTGTTSPSPGQVTVLPGLTAPYLGIVATGSLPNGDAKSVVLGAAPGTDGFPIGIRSIDITTNPVTTTSLVVNSAFADVQTIGPDGCQYASVSVAVFKITNADGSCPLNVDQPLLTLGPAVVSPNPAQGSPQSFTAAFHNVSITAGTPVLFQVIGANAQVKLANTDVNGHAMLSYAGVNAGSDTIVASATANSSTLTSNPALVTWTSGPHTTFLSLNNSPSGADVGKPVTLAANLVDVSVNPAVAVAGATIQFMVDGRSCSGVTNASGVANCSLTVPDVGAFTLSASYAGATNFLPATTSEVFSTLDRIFANGFDPLL